MGSRKVKNAKGTIKAKKAWYCRSRQMMCRKRGKNDHFQKVGGGAITIVNRSKYRPLVYNKPNLFLLTLILTSFGPYLQWSSLAVTLVRPLLLYLPLNHPLPPSVSWFHHTMPPSHIPHRSVSPDVFCQCHVNGHRRKNLKTYSESSQLGSSTQGFYSSRLSFVEKSSFKAEKKSMRGFWRFLAQDSSSE